MEHLSRRHFMQRASAVSLGFAGLSLGLSTKAIASAMARGSSGGFGFGPLVADPAGIFDLPAGFAYTIISRHGEMMSDGFVTPGKPDGMAAFPLGADAARCVIVRNHEIDMNHKCPRPFDGVDGALVKAASARAYDAGNGTPLAGGTTNLVFNTKTQKIERSFLSLVGTERNCAGGPTPWGTWITCEETVSIAGSVREKEHGWNFEVPATGEIGLAEPLPLKAMGRFNHEAVAFSPGGNIYQTEDRSDGLLFRFVPKTYGKLTDGGKLQALVVRDRPSLDTRNWSEQTVKIGERMACAWIDVDEPESMDDSIRYKGYDLGAARFARGEGMWAGADGIYFCCTNGGAAKCGQIFRLRFPNPKSQGGAEQVELELFVQPDDATVLQHADNVTVSPSGHLVVCEDGKGDQHLIGVSPKGECYKLARNAMSGSELAGACFSPDGSTLFVNIQHDGLTLAITGPWKD